MSETIHNSKSAGRIEREKQVVAMMVRLYCRRHDHIAGDRGVCADCAELLDYAWARLDHCRFGHAKPACKRCPIHCYRPSMRARMQALMRYSGPRMLLYMPGEFFRHLLHK